MTAVITIAGLRKSYGDFEAVRGIDLEVQAGEIFAFLGPNGAGKTTTVEILEGFRERSAGEVTVLGEDPGKAGARWREKIGAVLQESTAEPGLTVTECVTLYAGYYRAPRDIDETIELVGLSDKAFASTERLSGGQRRRLDVALGLIGDPDLIFLDEPTTGFDASARRAAWEVVRGLRDLGKTVFLTTHYMEEAEHLADRIAVISAGEIVAEGTPGSLGGRDQMAARVSFTLPSGHRELPDRLAEIGSVDADGQALLLSKTPLLTVAQLAEWAGARGLELTDLDVRRPTLEDVYLELTAPSRERGGRVSTTHIDQARKRGFVSLVIHQARFDILSFARNRQARFFTVLLPIIFLVIFVSVFGNKPLGPQHIKGSTYYVPGLAALAVISAAFMNLTISIVTEREAGILKRRRATPVSSVVLIAGRTVTSVIVALVVMTILLVIGRFAYGVHLSASTLPGIFVTGLVGAVAFCCLGYALSTFIGTADAAPPMVQAIMLPLYFISGVFIPNINLPNWLQHVAKVFPVSHLASGLHHAFDPTVHGSGIVASDLLILAAWGVGGLLIALKRFTWTPVLATS